MQNSNESGLSDGLGSHNLVEGNAIPTKAQEDKVSEQKTDKEIVHEQLDKITDLSKKSSRVIYRVETVFPFQLFPTAIVLDEVKVLIIQYFLFGKHVFPIFIKDIKTVTFGKSLIFGSISFEIAGYEKNPDRINTLSINGALKMSRLILAMIVCTNNQIDLSKISIKEVIDKLEKIGAETSSLRT